MPRQLESTRHRYLATHFRIRRQAPWLHQPSRNPALHCGCVQGLLPVVDTSHFERTYARASQDGQYYPMLHGCGNVKAYPVSKHTISVGHRTMERRLGRRRGSPEGVASLQLGGGRSLLLQMLQLLDLAIHLRLQRGILQCASQSLQQTDDHTHILKNSP